MKYKTRIIKIKAKELVSFTEKSVGLILSKNIESVYFETKFGIHTFFMRKPIDVIVMDKNFMVRVIKKVLKPWKVFVWNPKYCRILEMSVNSVDKNKIKKGDKIKILKTNNS